MECEPVAGGTRLNKNFKLVRVCLLFTPPKSRLALNVIHPIHQSIIVANNYNHVGCARSGEFGPWPSPGRCIEAAEPEHERCSSTEDTGK